MLYFEIIAQIKFALYTFGCLFKKLVYETLMSKAIFFLNKHRKKS